MSKSMSQEEREYKANTVISPLNGEQPLFARIGYQDLRTLEGKMLTIVDASFQDPKQRKAVKDLVRQAIWFQWADNLERPNQDMPVGMPVAE